MRQEDTMKKSFAAAACLLLLVHSLPCRAAEGASLPPPIVAVATILELSEGQVQALVTMIGARDTALRPLAEELQRHQQALEQLLRTPDADAATVGRLVLETRTLSANMANIRGQASAQFEQVLTPEQLEKLQHIREAAAISEILPAFRAAGLV
jgi:Spy/CpxP family protein refolding chaperone